MVQNITSYHCILWQKRESMLKSRQWILSDLEMLVSGVFMNGYLNSSPIINLPTNNILQLSAHSLAAWAFCMRLSRVLPSSLIMSGQTPAATPLGFIKFWNLMKSAPKYPPFAMNSRIAEKGKSQFLVLVSAILDKHVFTPRFGYSTCQCVFMLVWVKDMMGNRLWNQHRRQFYLCTEIFNWYRNAKQYWNPTQYIWSN